MLQKPRCLSFVWAYYGVRTLLIGGVYPGCRRDQMSRYLFCLFCACPIICHYLFDHYLPVVAPNSGRDIDQAVCKGQFQDSSFIV